MSSLRYNSSLTTGLGAVIDVDFTQLNAAEYEGLLVYDLGKVYFSNGSVWVAVADTAISANTARFANTSALATFANNAANSTFANTAALATFANTAQLAIFANNAANSTFANTAQLANVANLASDSLL